ncbi:MAG: DUF2339 domain-containing protein, partial [Planctomycetes bacterium]|nr:DUF2339 domain-containing protein [Planctomycetota bacterium]
ANATGPAPATGRARKPATSKLDALLHWVAGRTPGAATSDTKGRTPIGATSDSAGKDIALEARIGGIWFNRIGAFILLLSAGFFVKLMFDRGWISETFQVLIVAAFGLALVGVGEYCLKKGMRTFAGGVLGCGIGVLYIACFGAHNYYGLVGQTTASVLYSSVTIISVAISVHARMLPVAIVALIGGFGTPLLLSTGQNKQVALLTYVLMLDVGFLVTATIRRWDVLRILTWAGTVALFVGWYVEYYADDAVWRTAGFVLAFYVVFHAEALVALRRRAIQRPHWIGWLIQADNVIFFGSIFLLLRHTVPDWMGLFAVSTAALQWVAAWRICPPGRTAAPVRRALWTNGAAMLALAAPMQFDRYLVSISWSIQAVVTLCFCRRYDEYWLRLKGTGVLVAAVFHLFVFDHADEKLNVVIAEWGHWSLSWVLLLFVLVALCAYAGGAALVAKREAPGQDRPLSAMLLLLGTCLILGIFADQWERYLATWWWVGLGVLWWGVARRLPTVGAMVGLIAAATIAKFLCWDTVAALDERMWSELRGIVLNRMVVSGLVVAAFAVLARIAMLRLPPFEDPRIKRAHLAMCLAVAAAVVVLWAGTFEILRVFRFEPWAQTNFDAPHLARGVFITAFWAVNAAVIWLVLAHRHSELAAYALLLTWLTTLKLMLIDTLGFALSGAWESLVGICTNRNFVVGLFVLALGFLAHWRMRRLPPRTRSPLFSPGTILGTLVLVLTVITWVPTFEIARVFRFESFADGFDDPTLAMQVAISVYWGLNASALLVVGFAGRFAVVRYAAIALFGLTIGKVFLVDLAHLDMLYRVISFMVVGALLMAASLLYQRLSARITEPSASGESAHEHGATG